MLVLDPQARHQAGRRLVRLIAGNPVTMGQMTRHLPAAGSYAPVTILIQELPDGGTQVACDTAASAIAPYGSGAMDPAWAGCSMSLGLGMAVGRYGWIGLAAGSAASS